MLTALFFQLVNRFPKARRVAFRCLFGYLARRSAHVTHWTQMNCGYAGDGDNPYTIALSPHEERERYSHQLYLKAVNGYDLSGCHVVEVSSGRGGGAHFVHKYMKPQSLTGVDIVSSAVKFCRKVHHTRGLRFVQGDAERLPLYDDSADAVINVEASFCYGDMGRFLAEVRRVLKPGGYFFFADLRHACELDRLAAELAGSGLEVLEKTDITRNVVRALDFDAARRNAEIRALAPRFLRYALGAFAGTPGSRIPTMLEKGQMRYLAFVLRKPEVSGVATRVLPPAKVERSLAQAA